jgi:hypothetical protein
MKRGDRQLRHRCMALLNALDMPRPPTTEALCAAIGRHRGRRLELVPVITETGTPCGIWLATGGTDYILYESVTTPVHQVHIILHEAGHIVLGHSGLTLGESRWERLFPRLDPELVRLVMGRTAYTNVEEREAEIFADTAYDHLGWDKPVERLRSTHVNPIVGRTVDRLSKILESPPERSRG